MPPLIYFLVRRRTAQIFTFPPTYPTEHWHQLYTVFSFSSVIYNERLIGLGSGEFVVRSMPWTTWHDHVVQTIPETNFIHFDLVFYSVF